MKSIPLGLNTNVVTVYDQTKTTVLGRAAQKTLTAPQGGKQVVGTPLPTFADVITDAVITPIRMVVTANNRAFFFNAPAAGVGTIALYNFDLVTGVWGYVGKVAYTLPNSPATTHTIRSVRAVDVGTTGWKIFVGDVGTITTNGGLFMINSVALTDFTVSPVTLPVATASGQKAVYFLQESGGTNNLIAMSGFGIDLVGTKLYVGNGLAAAFVGYVFDYSLAITTVLAGGITVDMFVFKTGTLPGVLGTLLLLNSVNTCTPTIDSGAPVGLHGSLCLFLGASAGFNMGKVSDWTNGGTSWPSLSTVDQLDAGSTHTVATPITAHFSDTIQRVLFQHNSGTWVVKKFVNTMYELVFGCSQNTQFRTGGAMVPFYEFGAITVSSTFTASGWIFILSGATAGQIGALAFDLRSLYLYDFSAIISKVLDTPNSQWVSLSLNSPLRSFGKFYYRTTGFGSATGNWIDVPTDRILSAISSAAQVQFKLQPRMERDGSTIPLQLIESHLVLQPNSELSDNWVGSVDNTATGSPSRSAFRLIKAYTSVVPQLFFRAYDDAGTLVASANTVANPTLFEYSTNNGSSWVPLGTIPNTALTTELRYNWASPPGVKVTVSVRES